MPADSKHLVEAALLLRAMAPHEWEQFCLSMREYAAQQVTEMMKCDPALLLRAQGMAIMAGEIAEIVVNAPKIAERAQQFRKERPHVPGGQPTRAY